MQYLKKYLALLLILLQFFSLTTPVFADIIFNDGNEVFEPGEICWDTYSSPMELKVDGDWQAVDNDTGEIIGITTAFAEMRSGRPSNWRNYTHVSPIKHWVEELGGNWDWYSDHAVPERMVEDSEGNSRIEFYIRDVVHKCGGYIPEFDADKDEFYVVRTEGPGGGIYPTSWSVKAGETTTIKINPSSNVPSWTYPGTDWEFYIDGSLVDSGHESQNTAWIEIDYTFPEARSYELDLEVTDGVGREHSANLTFPVADGSQPPPPPLPSDSSGPTAYFSIQQNVAAGDTITTDNQSTAGGDNYLVAYEWDVSPSSGVDISSSWAMEPDITFNDSGAYDVTLTVWDNKDNFDSMTKTVFVEEAGPPPPPPPPPNSPPTARIDMPSNAKQGDTVTVENDSYDDGEIVDVSWDISPMSGVSENLGFDGGTITFMEQGTYTVTLEVTDEQGASDTDTETIEISNKPPVAKIDVPDEVMQGENITVESDSYDPDGSIASYEWTVTSSDTVIGTLSGESSTVYFDQEGEYIITLTVEDEWGLSDTTEKTITVKPAIPEAYFYWTGDSKQNRKVVFDATDSYTSDRYPIVWEETQWEFIPPDGVSQDAVKIHSSGDLSIREVLFKEPGTYTVRLTVKNTAGHTSEWYEEAIEIRPDEPPVADFKVIKTVLRDPDNNNKARIDLTDRSVSYDGDDISKRVWKYRYDSDNDGSFTDETWQIIDENNNLLTPTLYVTDIGKYQFELEIEESFGQSTISDFIGPEDIKKADTYSKPLAEKTVEVINVAPITSFEAITKKKADIVFTIGEEVNDTVLDNLEAVVNSQMKPKLENSQIDYSIEVPNIESTIETKVFNYSNRINIESTFAGNYGGEGGGNTADGGWDTGQYYFGANNRYIDIGRTIGIEEIQEITFRANTGYGSHDLINVYCYVSNDGNTWYKVGQFKANAYQLYSKTFYKADIPINNIRYFRAGNDYCVDNFYLDIIAYVKNYETIDEVLDRVTWRQGTKKFIIGINNIEYAELKDQEQHYLILSRLINDGIYFGVLGTNDNKIQAENIIQENNNKGFFTYNSNMDQAISNVTDYIVNTVNTTQGYKTVYVLLNEEVTYNTFYSDTENDPEIERRWKYVHDPYYFDNSLGLAGFHDQFISGPIYSFDKVGKYDVVFQAKDNPKDDERFTNYRKWSDIPADHLTVYVHRKPLALYSIQLTENATNYSIDITDNAYDMDHQTEPGKGIIEREWKWKEATTTSWNIGQPSILEKNKTYVISYRVKDVEGVWSDYNVKVVDTGSNIPPVAQFTVSPNPLPLGKTLSYDDFSYDPNGDNLVQYQWRYQDPGGSWHNAVSSFPSSVYNQLGEYRIELKVQDENGEWSEAFYQTVNVVPSNNKPVAQFTVSPNPLPQDVEAKYTDTSYDPDGDPIVAREWQYRKNGSSWANGQPTDFETLGTGTYDIRLRVKDQPALASMTAQWSDWFVRMLSVIPGNQKPVAQFSILPNPVAADEPVTYNDNSYDPDGAGITERVWQVRDENNNILAEYHNTKPPSIFESTGWGDYGAGTYIIALKVKDASPNGLSPALWSDWCEKTLVVEDPLYVEGESDKNIYAAGEAMILSADTEGRAFKVEAKMWWDAGENGFASTNVTELVPEYPIGGTPPDINHWETRHDVLGGDYDRVVIIPYDMSDGTYTIEFTAYKERYDGTVRIVTDMKTVQVSGSQLNKLKTRLRSY
ncbi:MAG: domain containing protein [Clostridiales bacterium]|jgi:PKD repeat protein|nr:domain containing protein [Clostridiales bacterium]